MIQRNNADNAAIEGWNEYVCGVPAMTVSDAVFRVQPDRNPVRGAFWFQRLTIINTPMQIMLVIMELPP